jgi:hypothetical protein
MPTFKAPHTTSDDETFTIGRHMAEHLESYSAGAAERRRDLTPSLRALTSLTDKMSLRAAENASLRAE